MEWPLLAGLADGTRRDVLGRARRRRFDRRQALFYEGDPSDGMHLVVSGWVAIRVSTPLGDTATVAVAGPHEPLGEQSLLNEDDRRSASAVALSATETLYLSRADFDAVRSTDPSVDRFLAGLFNDRLRRTSARLLEALYVPTPQRVLRRVAEVAETFGTDGVIPLTQEDVATLAGTTRPTVNRALRKAEEAGAVQLSRGRIRIVDVPALTRLAR